MLEDDNSAIGAVRLFTAKGAEIRERSAEGRLRHKKIHGIEWNVWQLHYGGIEFGG
jgi:hypothetical protein